MSMPSMTKALNAQTKLSICIVSEVLLAQLPRVPAESTDEKRRASQKSGMKESMTSLCLSAGMQCPSEKASPAGMNNHLEGSCLELTATLITVGSQAMQ